MRVCCVRNVQEMIVGKISTFGAIQLTNKSAVREDIGALYPSSVQKELAGNCFLNARIHTKPSFLRAATTSQN